MVFGEVKVGTELVHQIEGYGEPKTGNVKNRIQISDCGVVVTKHVKVKKKRKKLDRDPDASEHSKDTDFDLFTDPETPKSTAGEEFNTDNISNES